MDAKNRGFPMATPISEDSSILKPATMPPRTVWDYIHSIKKGVGDLEDALDNVVEVTCPSGATSNPSMLFSVGDGYPEEDMRYLLEDILKRVNVSHDRLLKLHHELK